MVTTISAAIKIYAPRRIKTGLETVNHSIIGLNDLSYHPRESTIGNTKKEVKVGHLLFIYVFS